jgi:hypothetical protein
MPLQPQDVPPNAIIEYLTHLVHVEPATLKEWAQSKLLDAIVAGVILGGAAVKRLARQIASVARRHHATSPPSNRPGHCRRQSDDQRTLPFS